jgi:putative transposase
VDKRKIFYQSVDYEAFLGSLGESAARYAVDVLGYNVLENHFHLVLRQRSEGAVSAMLRRVTCCSARYYRKQTSSMGLGHVYQNRFWSAALSDEARYLVGLRYVEDNARQPGLVRRAEEWQWGSLWERVGGDRALLAPSLVPLPENWVELVNHGRSDAELVQLRSITSTRTHFTPVIPPVEADRYLIASQPPGQDPAAIQL